MWPIFMCAAVFLAATPCGAAAPEIASPAPAPAAPAPSGQEKGSISGDVFGKKGGWVHFGLALNETYSDNINNAPAEEKSDFITTVSPAIWIAMPGIKQDYDLATGSMKPGGMSMRPSSPEEFNRYQAYLLYQADLEYFKDYDEENDEGHRLEGIVNYNLKGGLGLGLIGQFLRSHDRRGSGDSTELDRYETGLGGIVVSYDLGAKTNAQAGYSRFLVNYLDERTGYRDRQDGVWNATVNFKYSPKTSFFTEYKLVDIAYDSFSWRDSREHHIAAGASWKITDKSRGSLKAGYIIKNFEVAGLEDDNEVLVGLRMDHAFTPKTSLSLEGERLTKEINVDADGYMVSHGLNAVYRQEFVSRWIGSLRLGYDRDAYQETDERRDSIYLIRPALAVPFGQNFTGEVAYTHEKRDSTLADYDYQTNRWTAILSGAL